MCWLKKQLRRVGSASVSMLFLLMCLTLIPLSAVSAHAGASGVATPTTVIVQATPTEDATVTALTREQLAQQVAGQQHTWDNWLWSNAAVILSSFLSTLVVVIGGLFGFWQWRVGRMDIQKKASDDQKAAQDKELEDRKAEREKRAEERFQSAVTGLGNEKEGAKIGAAILLRTFLRPGYEQFYTQTFDLAIAHLRLRNRNPDAAEPLDTLNQALITVFKESFPLARDQLKKENVRFRSQSPVGRYIQLDNAYLREADLEEVWMPQASLRKVDLSWSKLNKSNLSGSDLDKATFSRSTLSETTLEDALSLKDTDLRGAKGLTKEQLKACKAKGAIIDEEPTTSPSQPTVAPASPPQSNDLQASAAPPPVQESTPTTDPDGSTAASSQQKPES